MTQRWMLTSQRDIDEGEGQTCPDNVDTQQPHRFVLRCQGGGTYSADDIAMPCPCGKPLAALVRGELEG